MLDNMILNTDSYKVSHFEQYPPNTTRVYSYWESRGGEFDETVMFGLNYLLKKYLTKRITVDDVNYAEERFKLHFGDASLFNRKGWMRIVNTWGGYLPVHIKAVPEGTPVPVRNVLMTVENTDPYLPWLTNYLETVLCQLWYPTTVATNSREIKKIIKSYLEKTGDPSGLPFKLHDFGFRGVSSVETAALGGAAHLVNFMGTDTMVAFEMALMYYDDPMAGFSIPAAEHSTITSWGRENEVEAYRNMINKFGSGGSGLYAVISDSYDIFYAVENLWGNELFEEVMAAPNTLVVRPDSGDPPTVVLKVLNLLGKKFGTTRNAKGYDVLNKVRVIQGDGIDLRMVEKILETMEKNGWSADNIAFGSGGGLLQRFDRDTARFAFKCSAILVDGEGWRDVWKDPVTSSGKASKRGRLKLIRDGNTYRTVRLEEEGDDVLESVFRNGSVLRSPKFSEIRQRAEI